ncbi:hypothetical protein [Streptomyces sp. NPDC004267]|uniref:hypothetical protein n=1 Tax=Streptomyces sp. NPDC004267 TaxID=3364694 RepID=UPI00368B6928
MSTRIREIIAGLNRNARAALLATAAASDGRVPYTVHDRTVDALERRQLIREVNNPHGGFNWCILTPLGKRIAVELAARTGSAQPAQGTAPAPALATTPAPAPVPARPAELRATELESQHFHAAQIFAALHPAARHAVESFRGNGADTIREGGPYFTATDIWNHLGGEPGAWLTDGDWATADGLNEAFAYLDRRAAAGTLSPATSQEAFREALAILGGHASPAPLITDKTLAARIVLFAFDADPKDGFPVHSVALADRLCLGRPWRDVKAELSKQGLTGWHVRAASDGEALSLVRARWNAQQDQAARLADA